MTQQLNSFDAPPAHNGTAISRLAAEQLEGVDALRKKVLDYIASCGERGSTDEECQLALPINPSTQRPRRVELARQGRIVLADFTRLTKAGRKAQCWIAREYGNGS